LEGTFVLHVPHTPWLQDDAIATPAFFAAVSTVSEALIVNVFDDRDSLTVNVFEVASLEDISRIGLVCDDL
jgi:hypothetical protein